MAKTPKVLLMDANVLIDYQKSDFSVLCRPTNLVSANALQYWITHYFPY